ncbi:MAG: hypothetical protein K0R59_1068 [Sphingobacterium sp.]|jgi:hypothetical protein|nr:hypothetical protein [Sphingobacterium sp.]
MNNEIKKRLEWIKLYESVIMRYFYGIGMLSLKCQNVLFSIFYLFLKYTF